MISSLGSSFQTPVTVQAPKDDVEVAAPSSKEFRNTWEKVDIVQISGPSKASQQNVPSVYTASGKLASEGLGDGGFAIFPHLQDSGSRQPDGLAPGFDLGGERNNIIVGAGQDNRSPPRAR